MRAADRPARAVLAGGGRRGRRAEGVADAEGRAGAHHGAQRLHVAEGDNPRTRHHRQRPDQPLAAVESLCSSPQECWSRLNCPDSGYIPLFVALVLSFYVRQIRKLRAYV